MSDVQATSEPTTAAPVASVNPSTPAIDPQSFAAMQKEIAELRKESADRRIAAKTANEEAAKRAAEAGDFKALADQYRAQLEEIKPKLAIVDEAQEFMNATAREIDALKPTLPTYLQTAIDNAPSLKVKREIISQYQAAQPQQPQRGAPIPVANPAQPAATYELDSFTSVRDVREAAKSDPKGFRAGLDKIFAPRNQPSSLDALFNRGK